MYDQAAFQNLRLLLSGAGLGGASLEFFKPASGVHHLLLSRVERMRGRRNVHAYQWVLLTIGPFFGLVTLDGDGRTDQKALLIGVVFEDYQAVIFRVDVFFHKSQNYSSFR